MKPLKTLLFILFALKVSGQNEKTIIPNGLFESSNVKWDTHFALGGCTYKNNGSSISNSAMFASQLSLSCRFKNNLYTSLSYVSAKELNILAIFGIMTLPDKIKKISIIGGVHYTGDFYYFALGGGLSKQNGQYWDFTANNQKKIQNVGFEIKAQSSIVATKFMAIGLSYNYNFNNSRNYTTLMFGLQFGRLQ
jgi:hypothetical protein